MSPLRTAVTTAAAGIVLALLGLTFSPLPTLTTLTTIAMMLAIAQGWNILGGYGGYLNFGIAGFFGIGAYTTALIGERVDLAAIWFAPVAALVAVLIALFIGAPTLRLRGAYFAIMTLLLTFVVQLFALNVEFTNGPTGITLPLPSMSQEAQAQIVYAVFAVFAIAATVGVVFFDRSRQAQALRSIREDEDGAEILGVDTTRAKLRAFLVGAAIAGAAGGIVSWQIGYIEPGSTFSLTLSLDIVLMVIIGGGGVWYGPVVGVPLVVLLSDFLRTTATDMELFGANTPAEFNRLVLGVLLIVIAMFFRRGFAGLIEGRRSRPSEV